MEKRNALVVYFEKEKEEKVDKFFEYLKKEGFEGKCTGPNNCPTCPWVFELLDEKITIRGRAGIEYAPHRVIEHAVLIDEFYKIYEIYKETKTLNDKRIIDIVKKYDGYHVMEF